MVICFRELARPLGRADRPVIRPSNKSRAPLSDGSELDVDTMVEKLIEVDPATVDIWVLEEKSIRENAGHARY